MVVTTLTTSGYDAAAYGWLHTLVLRLPVQVVHGNGRPQQQPASDAAQPAYHKILAGTSTDTDERSVLLRAAQAASSSAYQQRILTLPLSQRYY